MSFFSDIVDGIYLSDRKAESLYLREYMWSRASAIIADNLFIRVGMLPGGGEVAKVDAEAEMGEMMPPPLTICSFLYSWKRVWWDCS